MDAKARLRTHALRRRTQSVLIVLRTLLRIHVLPLLDITSLELELLEPELRALPLLDALHRT